MLNRVKSVMLMTLLGLILVSAGGYVGGQNGATMMFIIALILNFYSYWNSDKIVLKHIMQKSCRRIKCRNYFHW